MINLFKTAIIGFGIFAISCSNNNAEETHNNIHAEKPYCLEEPFRSKVKTAKIDKLPVVDNIHFTGTIQYAQDDLLVFKSLLEGTVSQVNFELGEWVNKGKVLATISSTALNELLENKSNIESQLALEKKQLDIKNNMLNDGLASILEVKELENSIEQLQNSLKSLESNLSIYNSTRQQGVFEILAPKSGYIVQKGINTGVNISALDEALFSISTLDKVWVLVDVHARDIPYVKKDASVTIKTTAYPDLTFEGKIDQISQVLSEEDRVLKARVQLHNKDLLLKPGMNAEAWIDKEIGSKTAIAIPNANIIYHNKKQYCLIYKDDCHIEIRPIDYFAKNDLYSYVNEGFEENEVLVASHELLIFEQINR